MTNSETHKLPRALRVAFWLLLAWSAVVVQVWREIVDMGLGSAAWRANIFYYLFLNYELIGWLLLMFGAVICLGVCLRRDAAPAAVGDMLHYRLGLLGLVPLLWCGTLFIYHRYPFSMDEYNSLFQAQIFASGHLKAVVPEAVRPFAAAITPVYVAYDAAASTWISMYFPVYAALRALCLPIGLTDLLNPLLAVAAVVLIADCARRLWPEQPQLPLVAAVLLLTSTQFLATSISYYSMPAHLCANLLWVSLYLRDTRRSLALLPWVGGLALALHQPTVHPPFVLPFCLDIVRRRRFGLAAYCLIVYGGFLVLWQQWHQFTAYRNVDSELRWFGWPDREALFLQAMDLTLLASWQSVALVLGGLCAMFSVRRFSAPLWCLLAGVLLTTLLYLIYVLDQGHGWGHRYAYGVLGNVVLLATFGFFQLSEWLGQARASRLLIASTCFALLVQVPFRAFEVEREIRPFAQAREFLRTLPERMVVVDRRFIWYGRDLIRNDPDLSQPPILFDANKLSPGQLHALQRLSSVRMVRPSELASFKIPAHPDLQKEQQAARAP